MKDLEKKVRKQYKQYLTQYPKKGDEAVLRAVQDWAEDNMVKTDGKLTISSENELKGILDKIRNKSPQQA